MKPNRPGGPSILKSIEGVNERESHTHNRAAEIGMMTALVAGAIIALLAANIYLYFQIDHVRTDLAEPEDDSDA